MTDKITVDNYRLDSYNVKTTELADNSHIQHTRLDIGSGTTESSVSSANPLPVYLLSGGSGMKEPYHDEQVIDESAAPATTVITYKLGGVTVGTKTITVSGTTTTIVVA